MLVFICFYLRIGIYLYLPYPAISIVFNIIDITLFVTANFIDLLFFKLLQPSSNLRLATASLLERQSITVELECILVQDGQVIVIYARNVPVTQLSPFYIHNGVQRNLQKRFDCLEIFQKYRKNSGPITILSSNNNNYYTHYLPNERK